MCRPLQKQRAWFYCSWCRNICQNKSGQTQSNASTNKWFDLQILHSLISALDKHGLVFSNIKGNKRWGRCIFGVVMHLFGKCKHCIRTMLGSTFLSGSSDSFFWENNWPCQKNKRLYQDKNFSLYTIYTSTGKMFLKIVICCTWEISIAWHNFIVYKFGQCRRPERHVSVDMKLLQWLKLCCFIQKTCRGTDNLPLQNNWPRSREEGRPGTRQPSRIRHF